MDFLSGIQTWQVTDAKLSICSKSFKICYVNVYCPHYYSPERHYLNLNSLDDKITQANLYFLRKLVNGLVDLLYLLIELLDVLISIL